MWELLTTPRHLLRWWGPGYCPLVACEVDLRPGGAWRYVCRMVGGEADGEELAWHGEYQAIEAPARIVSTEVFEGDPDAASLNTMTLTEADGVTTLTTLVQHSSNANRDGHVDSGMEGGMQQTFDRLDETIAREMLVGMQPMDEMLRSSGHYGPKVEVGDDASTQDQLLAFTGRDPHWRPPTS